MIFLGYNLLFGMGKAEVDVAAHLGGLATGFCAGCAIAQRISGISKSRWRRSAVVALCGVVIAINCGAQIPVADDLSDQADRFAVTETRLLGLYNASVNKWKADQLSSEDFARILEKQLLPPWRAEREAFLRLKHLPEGQQRIKTTLIDYMTARTDAWSLLVEGARSNDVSLVRKAIGKQAEAEKLAARIAEMTK
jgi:hypothetical protein